MEIHRSAWARSSFESGESLQGSKKGFQKSLGDFSPQHIVGPKRSFTCRLHSARMKLSTSVFFGTTIVFTKQDNHTFRVRFLVDEGSADLTLFVGTFPIHGIRDDSVRQRETMATNTQHGQILAMEKDSGIFLGSGHQLLCIRGSPKHSGFEIRLSVRWSNIRSIIQPEISWLISSFLIPSFPEP
ncbi:hypothetical protein TNCV_2368731 [Trichonephila clavipes]|nr:hypothetical protein TNCV_2368731 [Trichonephila clavipes]